MSSFRKPGENGPLLVSDTLKSLVCTKTNRLLDQGPAAVSCWKDSFYKVLLTAWHPTMMLILGCGDTVNDLTLTCMAISALSEYLMNAMNGLCIRVKVETPITQKFRRTVLGLQLDCGLPITQRMKQQGWCPHDIELLKGSQVQNVSTLWYLANLSPTKSNMAHATCTSAECDPFRIDKKEYVPSHVRNECNCAHVGPDQNKLAEITRSGNIPLVRVLHDQVQVISHVGVGEFITISHVWADGKGNPRGNALPLCVIRELRQLVNKVPHEEDNLDIPFWLDTLCIPRKSEKLRKEAILRMREPYEQALHVLVIDAYLRSHVASERSPFEMLARIQVCAWSQRLWTFQEGRIPRGTSRTWFAFKDKSVDLFNELDLRNASLIPTLPSRTVYEELLFGHNQTQVIGEEKVGFTEDLLHSPLKLRQSLASPSPKHPGNWVLKDSNWEGPNECFDAPPPHLGPAGLTTSRAAWGFLSGDVSCQKQIHDIFDQYKPPPGRLFLSNDKGQWFGLDLYEPWHNEPRLAELGSHWAIILAGSQDLAVVSDESYRKLDEFMSPNDHQGLLVSYYVISEEVPAVKVTAHRHVRIGLVSSRRRDVQNQLRQHADQLCIDQPGRVTDLRQDADALEEFIRSQIGEEVRDNKALLEIVRAINVRQDGRDCDDLAYDDCIKGIRLLMRLGPCTTIQKMVNIFWCVD
ncbi:hypothetical protein PG988_002177 [Apiospora saccharicola]